MSSPIPSDACKQCGQPAIISRPFSGEVLCKQCFKSSIITKVRKAISKWRMLQRTDRIAVAFSGGKDSTTLLSVLVEIQSRFPESEVIAVTLDEGIVEATDRNHTAHIITQLLGVEHVVSSYETLFSVTLDEIAEHIQSSNSPLSPCAYCGVLRRQGLNILARQINADKLALGHNLDDEVQSMLMNLIRGDIQRLARLTPVQSGISGWLVPRIKPLHYIPEKEIALYAEHLELPYYRCPCTYGGQALRTEIRNWLNSFEELHPGSKYNLSSTISKIISALPSQSPDTFQKCRICTEPTSREVCAVCEYLMELRRDPH